MSETSRFKKKINRQELVELFKEELLITKTIAMHSIIGEWVNWIIAELEEGSEGTAMDLLSKIYMGMSIILLKKRTF